MPDPVVSRRDLLKAGLIGGAGLVLAVHLDGCARLDADPPPTSAPFAPDAWIRIGTDGIVTVVVDRSEMGQGVTTALPMLVAEELDADWAMVRFEQAPVNPAYVNPLAGSQRTGGSTSVRAAWLPMRRAAAKARAMLVLAAARAWGVPARTCTTERGVVRHPATGRSASYGELAAMAGRLPVPADAPLKQPGDFRIIGRPLARLDVPSKVNGSAVYGIDVQVPGLLVATVARCPVFGGRLRRFDPARALAVPGVRHVVPIETGVAVVADGYWQALRGRQALTVEWDDGPLAGLDSTGVQRRLEDLASEAGVRVKSRGSDSPLHASDARVVSARYDLPYLAHATMEPTNATAHVAGHRCTVWVPTQYQSGTLVGDGAREVAAHAAGLPPSAVTVHTTLLGGAFGRRVEHECLSEAVQLSKAVGAPVKVIYSREDDIRHDHYRPVSHHRLEARLDPSGRPVAWRHKLVAPSIMSRFVSPYLPGWLAHRFGPVKHGIDNAAVEGAASPPYRMPAFRLDYVMANIGVPLGFWRSVGHSHNIFVVESFIDELAAAAGADPYRFRRELLVDHPRLLAVLDLAADKALWGSPAPEGLGRGIAIAELYGGYVGLVAEAGIERGAVVVRRVVCAVDVGTVVNPDIAAAQVEGGIVFGLTAALKGEISFKGGAVRQGNFDDYQLLRLPEMPAIEVFFVPSAEPPAGLGEVATPVIAPAVANALARATGRRVRRLPIRPESLSA